MPDECGKLIPFPRRRPPNPPPNPAPAPPKADPGDPGEDEQPRPPVTVTTPQSPPLLSPPAAAALIQLIHNVGHRHAGEAPAYTPGDHPGETAMGRRAA